MALKSDLTIVEALQQSRRRLLYDSLPLLASTRPARAKLVASTNLPPYELQHIITLSVSIGPHLFERTRLSRVAWISPQASTESASAEPIPDSETFTTTPLANDAPDLGATSIEALIAQNVASTLATASTSASNGANYAASSTSTPPTRRPALALQFDEASTHTYLVPLHFVFEPLPAGKAALSFILVPENFKRLVDTSTTKDAATGEEKPSTRNYPVPMSIKLEQTLSKSVKAELEALSCSKGKDRQKIEAWWNRMLALMPAPTHVVKPRPPTPPPPPEPRDFSLFISATPFGAPQRPMKLASATPTTESTPGPSNSGAAAPVAKKRKRTSTSAASRRRSSAAAAKRRESSVSSSTPGRGSSATPGPAEVPAPAVPRVSSSLKEVVSAATSEAPTTPAAAAPAAVPAVATKLRSGRTHRPKSFGQESTGTSRHVQDLADV
ncbi:BQ2448_3793 [Microbotryum intermedium]|uniref:BQ2448_3793 protein n=1 Tax=Microbotryum intermedium TaxID=269621 RepID=A0A238FFX4_9BASI|nr:BQ2448_3793 [Microbotryum intermedium]